MRGSTVYTTLWCTTWGTGWHGCQLGALSTSGILVLLGNMGWGSCVHKNSLLMCCKFTYRTAVRDCVLQVHEVMQGLVHNLINS